MSHHNLNDYRRLKYVLINPAYSSWPAMMIDDLMIWMLRSSISFGTLHNRQIRRKIHLGVTV
eukprot:scaffold104405_cov23-Prasinocladus_malaysianus.AAC.1